MTAVHTLSLCTSQAASPMVTVSPTFTYLKDGWDTIMVKKYLIEQHMHLENRHDLNVHLHKGPQQAKAPPQQPINMTYSAQTSIVSHLTIH